LEPPGDRFSRSRRDVSASGAAGVIEARIYPVLFRIGGVEITSFGVLVAAGALIGIWIFRRELARARLPESGLDAAFAGLMGGIAGAKLLWVAEHLGEEPWTDLLFSRGGMSWFGGLAGGLIAGIATMRHHGLPVMATLAAASPALAVGHAVGRIGCFLVGDDYGYPSDLPWAVAFPQGLPPTDAPVHPTQLYEAFLLLPLAWMLVKLRRQGRSPNLVLGLYLIEAGTLRFAIEFLRINERILGPLSLAHLASLAAIVVGGLIVSRPGDTARPAVRH
jgi:phosphatidylglycerol---prolipoprotein diacylglyceryl transferase